MIFCSLLCSPFGCISSPPSPNIGLIYNEAAQNIGDDRNPVIVIPGILGSKLVHPESEQPIWGSFVYGAADADTAEGARLVALPMEQGKPLSDLHDEIVATEVLDNLTVDITIIQGVEFAAYVDILKTLAAGEYRDETVGEAGGYVDYAGAHYTCFQFPYDWRRDVAEQAALLHEMVLSAKQAQPVPTAKVDIVAHSMGGLVLRYYLRYGPDLLPDDGSLPELDWEGAQHVEHAILIGTPSGGSVFALEQLAKGVNFVPLLTPTYRPAVLGTMPAIYQLLPRTRHKRVIDRETREPIDLFRTQTWEDLEWGLLDPEQDRFLAQLLPEVETSGERRRVAKDHLNKSLARAEQLHRALDVPAVLPAGTEIHLIAGDSHSTPDVLSVNPETGTLSVQSYAPGDNTVTRASTLMDERIGQPYRPRLRSPVRFDTIQFLTSNHLGLTKDPLFVNFVLFTLLERPRLSDMSYSPLPGGAAKGSAE
ncbi:MAG: hypothetical protein AAGB34_01615 [Planctomycetota bacterium]